MLADFPLLYQATLAGVTVLNRIFQRQDVFIGMLIKISHHRRQRGGLPAASSASDQNQSVLAGKQCGYYRRRLDFRQIRTALGQ